MNVNVDDRLKSIIEYEAIDMLQHLNPGIIRPSIESPDFRFKPEMFQIIQNTVQFTGSPTEDPFLHLQSFTEVCDSFNFPRVSEETLRKLFPFSLSDQARVWIRFLPTDSDATWNDLAKNFLMKYYSPARNVNLREDIASFQQFEEESLYEAWEWFKDLLRKCPYHGFPKSYEIETFYFGLNAQNRMLVDVSANGSILAKPYNEAYEILERIAKNPYQWKPTRACGSFGVDAVVDLTAQVSSLTNMLKSMKIFSEQSGDERGNYDNQWSCWSNMESKATIRPYFQQQAHPQSSSVENSLKVFMEETKASLRNLEIQIGKLVNAITGEKIKTEDPSSSREWRRV